MKYNEIDIYINDILKKQLQKVKVSNHGLYSILNNVKKQLYSIIKNYQNKDFINALFLTVCEEGNFYEPHISNELGCLVVLGIRNSLYEVIASVDYKEYGLIKPVNDEFTKEVTTAAINYFKDIDLNKLSEAINIDDEDDIYKNISNNYPVAFNTLLELGKCNGDITEREYTKKEFSKYELDEINKELKGERTEKTLLNGYSLEIDDNLIHLLKDIKTEKTKVFYIDSIKYLSRNFEKNLRILEFILTHDAIMLTNNFLLSNDYVSRRENIIRSSHGNTFNIEAIKTIGDVSKTYKDLLENIIIV